MIRSIRLDYSKLHKETGNSVFGSHWSSKFALFFAQEMWVNAWRMLCCITNTCIKLTCPIFLQKYGKFAWKYSHLSISITMNNAIADLCVHLKSFSITKIIIYWFIWKKKTFQLILFVYTSITLGLTVISIFQKIIILKINNFGLNFSVTDFGDRDTIWPLIHGI